MQSIEQALKEVQTLHEQLTNTPAPQIGPHAFLPFPPGTDPVSYAIGEVSQLRQLIASRASGMAAAPGMAVPGMAGVPVATWMPRAGIFAGETTLRIVVELPGVAKEDLSVTVSGSELVVRGQRKADVPMGAVKPVLVELSTGPFERRFPVPAWCNQESVKAKCAQGVLEIQVSRPEDDASGEFCVEIA